MLEDHKWHQKKTEHFVYKYFYTTTTQIKFKHYCMSEQQQQPNNENNLTKTFIFSLHGKSLINGWKGITHHCLVTICWVMTDIFILLFISSVIIFFQVSCSYCMLFNSRRHGQNYFKVSFHNRIKLFLYLLFLLFKGRVPFR